MFTLYPLFLMEILYNRNIKRLEDDESGGFNL